MIKNIIIGFLILNLISCASIIPYTKNEEQQHNSLILEDLPGIQWSRQYGALGWDDIIQVRKTADNGYLMVGDTKSYGPDGHYAAWLIKTDAFGNEQWNHTYSSFAVFGTDCQQTADGGYAFCGVDNQSRYWLVKTDAQGIEQWEQSYDNGTAWCFTQTMDEGYIISGTPEVFIRTDAQGNVLWERTYFYPPNTLINKIIQTTDGGFIAAGKTTHYSQTYLNGFLIKLNENGSEEWNHTYFKSVTSTLFSFAQTPDDGYLAAGWINGSPWVVRTDHNGNELWNKSYPSLHGGGIDDVVSLDGGGYALIGEYTEDSFLLAIDENGTKQWDIPLDSYLRSLQQASDGGIVTAGNSYSLDSLGNAILMKIGHIPHASIIKPTNAFYLFDQERRPLPFPFIIGPITIQADAYDTEYSIDRVEFQVDDDIKNIDFTAPYSWRWSTPSILPHFLSVTAYNSVGNCSKAYINLYKLL